MPLQRGRYGPGAGSTIPNSALNHNPAPPWNFGSPPDVGRTTLIEVEFVEESTERFGTGEITQPSTLSSTGTKAAFGSATISQTSTVAGTGVRTIGGPGVITQSSSVASTGTKAAFGSATISQSSSATASSGATTRAGAGEVQQSVDENTDHTTARFGGSDISQSSELAAAGEGQHPAPGSGDGSISQTSTVAGTGTTARFDAGSISQESSVGVPAPATGGASYGNSLGTYFTYYASPHQWPVCRCRNGRASVECPLHCHLIQARQHSEDELVLLQLV